MLAGTGLNMAVLGPAAFTLLPPTTDVRALPRHLSYATAVQAAVTKALCQRSDTRLMHYRTVLRLWVGPSGVVRHVELASSTGDHNLDAAIVAALRHTDIGTPPPGSIPQPVKLAILPQASGKNACADSADRKSVV